MPLIMTWHAMCADVLFLWQVSKYIEEVYEPDGCFLKIKLDRNRIKLLKVSIPQCGVVGTVFAVYWMWYVLLALVPSFSTSRETFAIPQSLNMWQPLLYVLTSTNRTPTSGLQTFLISHSTTGCRILCHFTVILYIFCLHSWKSMYTLCSTVFVWPVSSDWSPRYILYYMWRITYTELHTHAVYYIYLHALTNTKNCIHAAYFIYCTV